DAVRTTEAKVTHRVFYRLPELFVRYAPGDTGRREKPKSIAFMEALGPVVAKVELRKITTVICVRQPAGKTGISERKRPLQVARVRIDRVPQDMQQQAAERVLVMKCPTIIQGGFHIKYRADQLSTFTVVEVFGPGVLVNQVIRRVPCVWIEPR